MKGMRDLLELGFWRRVFGPRTPSLPNELLFSSRHACGMFAVELIIYGNYLYSKTVKLSSSTMDMAQ